MKRYDSYKDSGIEWIGEIPSHWEIATVGRLCILGRGRVISAIEIAENEGVYPVYSSQTENYGIMGKINTYDFEGEYVTWTTDGANAGTVFYREGKFNCTNVCGTIQPKNWKQIDLKFLPYYLNLGTKFSVRLDINPKLMNNMMAKIPIAIPPISEQTSIASFLDRKTSELDEIIADKKRLLELYEEEKTAIINQAVTKGLDPNAPMKDSGIEWLGEIPEHWEVLPIKYVLLIPLTDGPHETPNLYQEGIPFISAEAIKGDKIDFSKMRGYISQKDHDLYSKKYKPQKGDVYMIKSGATTGNLARVETDEEFNIWSPLAAFRPNPKLTTTDFMFYYMKSASFFTAVKLGWNYGTQQNIGMNVLENLRIVKPPIKEQQSIVQHIESECSKIDFKKARTEELIELLTEYRTALVSEAVTGKIKVTED